MRFINKLLVALFILVMMGSITTPGAFVPPAEAADLAFDEVTVSVSIKCWSQYTDSYANYDSKGQPYTRSSEEDSFTVTPWMVRPL